MLCSSVYSMHTAAHHGNGPLVHKPMITLGTPNATDSIPATTVPSLLGI